MSSQPSFQLIRLRIDYRPLKPWISSQVKATRGSSQTHLAALSSPRQLQASKNAYDLRIHMQTYLQAWSTDS